MKAKEYLSQAYRIDQRINNKLDQVASLNDLAEKATTTLTGMPKNPNRAVSSMENIVVKIVDLQSEIDRDIDRLIVLKQEYISVIKAVTSTEHQTLLELRYLCFKTWEQIAIDMGYTMRHVYRIHDDALDLIKIPKRCH